MPAPHISVFDSLTRAQHPLQLSTDAQGELLRLYVCGITPYDAGHMGHAFTYAAFDVLVRYVEASGTRVRYVQNVTDVDTPLFEKARAQGIDWKQLATSQERSFVSDMGRLGWRPPDVMPKASEEVSAIEDAVQRLLARGIAYRSDGAYFDVTKYPGYGQLSRLSRDEMIEKLRDEELLGEVGPDAKRDALDFALWLRSQLGEPSWNVSFGAGRPGWHIECSVMAMHHLGEQVDVHGGGRDLVFSHHESERAQSECLTGLAPFAKLWMHTGLVHCDESKMSKSLGNLVLVSEALERASPVALRLYLASHHYREDWEFRWEELDTCEALAEQIRLLLTPSAGGPAATLDEVPSFTAALEDDLDTPAAIEVLKEAVASGDARRSQLMLSLLAGTASLQRGRESVLAQPPTY